MSQCAYSYDEVKRIQLPFELSNKDLLMISHDGQAKIITLDSLSILLNHGDVYIPVTKIIDIPIDSNKIIIREDYSDIVSLHTELISPEDIESSDIKVVFTAVINNELTVTFSTTILDEGYKLKYTYYIKSNSYNTKELKLYPGSNYFIINGDFNFVNDVLGVIRSTNINSNIRVSSIVINESKTELIFYFNNMIPDDGYDYYIRYGYILDSKYYNLNITSIDLSSWVNENYCKFTINDLVDFSNIVCYVSPDQVCSGEQLISFYVTDTVISGNEVTVYFNRLVPAGNYKLNYYFKN